MRISDWSSDVCSSDLDVSRPQRNLIASLRGRMTPDTQQSAEVQANLVKSLYASPASLMIGAVAGGALGLVIAWHAKLTAINLLEIGRASCRQRVCLYVYKPVVAVALKKNKRKN